MSLKQKRVKQELIQLKALKILDTDGIQYFASDDSDVGYGLVKGISDTPYEGGFYIFKIELSKEYPFKPPTCNHISISGLRQSPNFHDHHTNSEGMVCLSRLGTWEGTESDQWIPSMDLAYVLKMIQIQVLTNKPLDNEPDYDHTTQNPVNAKNYETFVRYHNIRSNIVDIYRKLCNRELIIPHNIQGNMAQVIATCVKQNYATYLGIIETNSVANNGSYVNCSTYTNSSCFCDYSELDQDFQMTFRN